MALGADDVEAASLGDSFAKFDVGAAARHVRRDGDGARVAGAGNDLGLLHVVFGVEDGVRNLLQLEHAAEKLARLHAGGADEHGLSLAVGALDRVDHGVVLFAARLVDAIVLVDAAHGTIRRDDVDVKAVDVVKLVRLGLGRAGHAGELLVKAEVVLDGDRGEGLRLAIDLDAFLGFDGLVKPVAPAASGHLAAGELVDDDDLVVLDDVLDVLLVEAVGLEELGDVVDPLRLRIAVLLPGRLLLGLFGIGERRIVLDVGKLA